MSALSIWQFWLFFLFSKLGYFPSFAWSQIVFPAVSVKKSAVSVKFFYQIAYLENLEKSLNVFENIFHSESFVKDGAFHRLKMELDLQSLFGLHVHSYTHWLRPRNLQPLPIPPHLGSYTRTLLVSQGRRYLFVTPRCYWKKGPGTAFCNLAN
jgi:hypothetical protein